MHGWNATDIYCRDLKAKKSPWKELVSGVDAEFRVIAYQGQFYIWTKHEAPRGKIYRVSAEAPARDKWKTVVAEDPSAVLDQYQIIGGHLVLTTLKNAASELQVRTLDGAMVRTVELPGIGASSGMTGLPEDDDAYFDFESMTLPPRIFKTSIKTGASELWAEVKVPVKSDDYVVEQVWYPSKDGTKISMFVVHAKSFVKDGKTPLLLYGYGGFNVNMQPQFRASVFPWLEAGGAYAVPNLRGGGEYGEQWHRDGMLLNKQNVFDDFIAAAEYLQREGYTSADRTAIRGGSNGGLLVGAAMTQRPELFKAVICHVPLLDMVRYHLFGSGATWIAEYGSAADEDQFKALYAYSPYHHVRDRTDYPGMLMLSADHDDRVDPMHARKMVAALQAATSGTRPILLRIEKNSGHGGADLVKQSVQESADVYAFLMRELGMSL
jgi:prolyl oligopeptidase